MRIIFLDIDGVLNSRRYLESNQGGLAFGQSQIDPVAVERLNQLIAATGARVIISSSWRHVWSKDEIVRMLRQRGLKNPGAIIGVTPSLPGPRGTEISRWLGLGGERSRVDPNHDPVQGYVILDDSDEFPEPGMRERFVRTNFDFGLTDDDVGRAIQILGTE